MRKDRLGSFNYALQKIPKPQLLKSILQYQSRAKGRKLLKYTAL